jgi:hypothetical protein
MTIEENGQSQDELWRRYHRHRKEDDDAGKGRFYQMRQWLNGIFIVLAIVGMIVWYAYSPKIGGITLISAVAFKFTELSLRIMKM